MLTLRTQPASRRSSFDGESSQQPFPSRPPTPAAPGSPGSAVDGLLDLDSADARTNQVLGRADSIAEWSAAMAFESAKAPVDGAFSRSVANAYASLAALRLQRKNRPSFTASDAGTGRDLHEVRDTAKQRQDALQEAFENDHGRSTRRRELQWLSAQAALETTRPGDEAYCGEHCDIVQALLVRDEGVDPMTLLRVTLEARYEDGTLHNHAVILRHPGGFPGTHERPAATLLREFCDGLEYCTVLDPWNHRKVIGFPPGAGLVDLQEACEQAMHTVHPGLVASSVSICDSAASLESGAFLSDFRYGL